MNKELLKEHIANYKKWIQKESDEYTRDLKERYELVNYYKHFTEQKIITMNTEDIYEYLSKLWAMLIWGNKHYVVDKIIDENGLEKLRKNLAELVWGNKHIIERWDNFRLNIKGLGPAMMSEILCKTHNDQYILWNRRAYVALNYLGVSNLPRYDYQLTGKVYEYLCNVGKTIAHEMKNAGLEDSSLLGVDYFIWHELQVEDNLTQIYMTPAKEEQIKGTPEQLNFVHNDIRDKLRDIGQWLGLTADTEKKVSDGAKVDVIWESTIGNMGRVIYVFEVQTSGSIDSLILNLLKSLNNPAVQGIVAVSSKDVIEKIKREASGVKELRDKLKYWDYQDVLRIHESLEFVNASINSLGLVPQSF